MNEVNKTLYIPLYGKAQVSKKGIILHDPTAETIWEKEGFAIKGKSRSKWLCYNMAMRARVFDDWTCGMIAQHADALVIHIGCGLDSRCLRVGAPDTRWIDGDFPDVIAVRKKYYAGSDRYTMACVNAADPDALRALPDAPCAIVVLEGISMYLTNDELAQLFRVLDEKYREAHILLDVYTVFGVKASRFKNPVNDVGVSRLYGVNSLAPLLEGTGLTLAAEHSFTPEHLVNELSGVEKWFFKRMFTGKLYRKIYRLFEVKSV